MNGFLKHNDTIFEIVNISDDFLKVLSGDMIIKIVNEKQNKIVDDNWNKIFYGVNGQTPLKKDYAFDSIAIINGEYYIFLNSFINGHSSELKDYNVSYRYDFMDPLYIKDYFSDEEKNQMKSLTGISKFNL